MNPDSTRFYFILYTKRIRHVQHGLIFCLSVIQPPENPYWQPAEPQAPVTREIPPTAIISVTEVKAALKAFADSKCCYGPTEDFQINESDIDMKSAFQVKAFFFS